MNAARSDDHNEKSPEELRSEGRAADIEWSKAEFLGLMTYMMNGHPAGEFLQVFPREPGDCREPYAKAKAGSNFWPRAEWAWKTITGVSAEKPVGIGFYPRNRECRSRWGAMDFDAHDGNADRAKRLAFAAFDTLSHEKELFLLLCTSGSEGWHLFAFVREFRPISSWAEMLHKCAWAIGCGVKSGVCEVFPHDVSGRKRSGAIRAPGTWNPKTNKFGKVVRSSLAPLLARLPSLTRERESLSVSGKQSGGEPGRSMGSAAEIALLYPITKPATRHTQLLQLVSENWRTYSMKWIREAALLQFRKKRVETTATEADHNRESSEMLDAFEQLFLNELRATERSTLGRLNSPVHTECFRIIRSWAQIAAFNGVEEFSVSTAYLATKLGVTKPAISQLRVKFCELGLMEKTAAHIPNKRCTQYRWLAADQAQLASDWRNREAARSYPEESAEKCADIEEEGSLSRSEGNQVQRSSKQKQHGPSDERDTNVPVRAPETPENSHRPSRKRQESKP